MLAEQSAVNPWIVIGPVAVTAIAGFGVAWVTARLHRSTEYETWVREQRRAAYTELLTTDRDTVLSISVAHHALAEHDPAYGDYADDPKVAEATATARKASFQFGYAYDRLSLIGTQNARHAAAYLSDAVGVLRCTPPIDILPLSQDLARPAWADDPDEIARQTHGRALLFTAAVVDEVGGEILSIDEVESQLPG